MKEKICDRLLTVKSIVVKYENVIITTVEGNSSDGVRKRTHTFSKGKGYAFGRPLRRGRGRFWRLSDAHRAGWRRYIGLNGKVTAAVNAKDLTLA